MSEGSTDELLLAVMHVLAMEEELTRSVARLIDIVEPLTVRVGLLELDVQELKS